ncbi:sugar phosphate isomerase/epimerase family protein [Planctomicrobium piriforme]|uniref:Sugar phosphate isomerase/epimerase n=1 Tax=Planctomicrobium piriforme TaxID=1576369 RepID=A0A1I3FIH0_9PLAN|nr:sugar phosphate isomerase/epimerase family protein [Planctomicrobium piriforme]SFI10912.1 Sugar phosphate isomerase/epimerase [Planctomicrobium piriforme]
MKFAICQELFEGWDWERQCRFMSETGYDGVEIAPFTLAPTAGQVTAAQREEIKSVAAQYGVQIIGLHWLLAKTTGFHLTTADKAVRDRTADYLAELGDLCADLGGTLMVLGSPQQRSLQPGVSKQQALDNAIEVLNRALPRLGDRGVDLLLEPLTTKETDFMNSCDEAGEIIRAIDHPNLALHQDVKAMLGEDKPIPEIIRDHAGITRHFHANDGNLRGPGMGPIDFIPIFRALQSTGYDGYVSVEVFDYTPGAENTAIESLRYMRDVWNKVQHGE